MSDPAFTQLRYPSSNSNFTVDSQVTANMQVPSSVGFADLSKSKFLFNMKLKAQNAGADVLYPCTFGKRGRKVGPECLIKQTQVNSDSGVFFERKNVNVVQQLYNLTQSRGTDDDRSFFGNTVSRNYGYSKQNLMPDTPFLVYDTPSSDNAVITASATYRNAEVPIPWKVIDPQGSMREYPFLASGKTDYTIAFVGTGDDNEIALCELPVNVATCDECTAVASFIGVVGSPLVTARESTEFENPPLVGQIIHVLGNQSTTGFGAAPINAFAEIATVAIVGNQYSITVVGGIATTDPVEVVDGLSFFWGARIDVREGAYKVDDFTGPFADINTLGTAAKPLTITDFYLQDLKTNFDLCPFYVGAPMYYQSVQPLGAAVADAITVPGTGYIVVNGVATTGGTGTGLTINIVGINGGGGITGVTIGAPGTGYTNGDTIAITTGDGAGRITITVTTATTIVSSYATVTTLTRAGNDLQLIVSQGSPSVLGNLSRTVQDVYLSFADHSNAGVKFTTSWSISRVIPQLHKITLTDEGYAMKIKAIQQGYNSYVLSEDVQTVTKNDGVYVSDSFQVPSLCVAAALLSPENGGLLSSFGNATTFSYKLDDKYPFIPVDVPIGSAPTTGRTLYNYLLKKYFTSINQVLRKYDAPYLDYQANDGYLDTNSILPMMVPYLPRSQTLNFTLRSTVNMTSKNYYLVSHHTKELQITKMGITMA